MTPLLHVVSVSKRYDQSFVLENASFSVNAGEVHALMGENGAGKSTLSRIVAGATAPTAAEIEVDGRAVRIRSLLDAQKLGISIIFQELDLFQYLSVAENVVLNNPQFREGFRTNPGRIHAFCVPFLERVGLTAKHSGRLVSSLSMGEMQLVAIARALSMRARILFMDEPTSSLMNDAVDRLFRLIRELTASGVAVVYVSHKMDEIFRICDRITVLRDGKTIGTRKTADTNNREVIEMMVGREVAEAARPHRHATGSVLLAVDNLTTAKLKGVSFTLHRGEVLGIAGLVGAGRSELGAALFGLDRIQAGTMQLRGKAFRPGSANYAIQHGMGFVPEDRKLDGLMMQMSIVENGTMVSLPRLQRFGLVDQRAELKKFSVVHARLALKYHSLKDAVSTLSGGNQQKTLLARWLLQDPDVIFLDDPTRGIDIAAKQDIYKIIDELANAGKGVLLVSSELPELLRCADRILVLNDGRLAATLPADTTQEEIMTAATEAAPLSH